MKKKNSKTLFKNLSFVVVVGVFLLAVVLVFAGKVLWQKFLPEKTKPINGLMMLIEFEKIDGILQWEKELDKRHLTALIEVQKNMLEQYPAVFKRLANKGYEISGHISGGPFWDMAYDEQYQNIKEIKEAVEAVIGKPMRVVNSGYFAYDETTLKAADALGVEYVLGRGTRDVEAVIYAPKEYRAKVISVSNVDVGEPMGRGSLCDYSLWARGADPAEFGEIVRENIAKHPANMILVSHAYLGGTRLKWWQQYETALSSTEVSWKSFPQWLKAQTPIIMPNAKIPLNKEVKYGTPQPAKPMDEYEPIPGLKTKDQDTHTDSDSTDFCQ